MIGGEAPASNAAWDDAGGRRRRDGAFPGAATSPPERGYYGVPAIHKPHWKWLIICYFYCGGIAGAAYAVAAISDAVGPDEDRVIGRTGRYLSLAALLPSPILLILDLGRPERFYLMLRVVKLRSPMSVGTWGLTAFGAFSTLSAATQAAADHRLGRSAASRRLARLPLVALGAAGTPFALFVAGYTGVLLAATAVPLWTKRARWLGPLFLSSALSNAVAAIELVLALAPEATTSTRNRLARLGALALIAESSIFAAWIEGLGATARPLVDGSTGRLVRHGVTGAGVAVPLLLRAVAAALPPKSARRLTVASSALVLAGGLALRYAVVVAGNASADDPRATLEMTAADDGAENPPPGWSIPYRASPR